MKYHLLTQSWGCSPLNPIQTGPLYIKTVLPLHKSRAKNTEPFLAERLPEPEECLGESKGLGNTTKSPAHSLHFCSTLPQHTDFSFTDGDSQLANSAKPLEK